MGADRRGSGPARARRVGERQPAGRLGELVAAERREAEHRVRLRREHERRLGFVGLIPAGNPQPARLASEIWDVIRREDWVPHANTAEDWALRLFHRDAPQRQSV